MEIDYFRLAEFILASVIIFLLLAVSIRQAFELQKVKTALANERQEKFVIYRELQKLKDSQSTNSDDFIKFLSKSREDAFEYIESVQDKIKNLINAWNSHTRLMPPDDSSERKLYEAYSDLVTMLPKEVGND